MARIESTGSYLPKKVVTNDQFDSSSKLFDSSPIDDFLTGYRERRHCSEEETGIMMASQAAKNALAKSKYSAEDIDLIIGGIVPSENIYGDDINLVQHELGAWNASVLPMNTGCSTFISSLNNAHSLIKTGKKKCVLILTAVVWTRTGLETEGRNYVFAGDGASAVILDDEYDSLIDVHEFNRSTPEIFNSMLLKNPLFTGQKEFFTISEPDGISTAKDLVLAPIKVAKTLLTRNKNVDVDNIFMHQSGEKMMQLWVEKLGLSFSKVKHTLPLFANMSLSSIPVSLDYWHEQGALKRGDTFLFFAPATGGHYISILWKY